MNGITVRFGPWWPTKRIVTALVAIHLLLAAAFAPHIPLEPILPRGVDRAIALYGTFSGVHTHFDFFAPSVSTQARRALPAPRGRRQRARAFVRHAERRVRTTASR
jgi:hypothetical protein